MKTLFFKRIIIIFTITTVVACKKPGTGGEATLVVSLKHHGNTIKSSANYLDTVYIKFNATQLPGMKGSDFDTFFVGETRADHVHCKGLKAGKYFLYGSGYDSLMMRRVTGGMAIKIKYSDRKTETSINLNVTE